MWRTQGLSTAIKKAASANADRKTGQLVNITATGEGTNLIGGADGAFVLLNDFYHAQDSVYEAQVTGIAKTFVEEAAGIKAMSPLAIGDNGVGVKLASAGDYIIGNALATPKGDSDFIPVLLAPIAKASNLY